MRYYKNESTRECQECRENCGRCVQPDQCLECETIEGLVLGTDLQCQCPQLQYANRTTRTCQKYLEVTLVQSLDPSDKSPIVEVRFSRPISVEDFLTEYELVLSGFRGRLVNSTGAPTSRRLQSQEFDYEIVILEQNSLGIRYKIIPLRGLSSTAIQVRPRRQPSGGAQTVGEIPVSPLQNLT